MTTTIQFRTSCPMTELHRQFLKSAFEFLKIPAVQVHNTHLELKGQKIQLYPIPEFPEYTNEFLNALPLEELKSLAEDFGFDYKTYQADDFQLFVSYYGALRSKKILKGFIYTHKENHPVRCYAKSRVSGKIIDLGKILWTCLKLGELSSVRYNLLAYSKPVQNLCAYLEIQPPCHG